jgi:manganese efflux pump family protein
VLALLLVAGALGLNNFAASIAIGLSGVDPGVRIRAAFAFGIFEAGMPIVGLVLGRHLAHTLGSHAHTVGGLLLIAAGVQTVVSAIRANEPTSRSHLGTKTGSLLLLAAVLSIDNLVVGFALGAYRTPLVLSVAIIALVSVGLSLLGLELGARLGARVEHTSELISGAVLISVGLAILINIR